MRRTSFKIDPVDHIYCDFSSVLIKIFLNWWQTEQFLEGLEIFGPEQLQDLDCLQLKETDPHALSIQELTWIINVLKYEFYYQKSKFKQIMCELSEYCFCLQEESVPLFT